MQQPNCEIHFGISALNNPSLIEKFYPSDLPQDWRLDYYSNEFRLLLVTLFDLDTSLSMTGSSLSTVEDSLPKVEDSLFRVEDSLPKVEDSLSRVEDSITRLTNTVSELVEEITGKEFILLLDLSMLPEQISRALLEHKPGTCYGEE